MYGHPLEHQWAVTLDRFMGADTTGLKMAARRVAAEREQTKFDI